MPPHEGATLTASSEQGLLAQILVEVQTTRAEVLAVSAEVSGLKVVNAKVVADSEHRATQTDDHETRLRKIEEQRAELVTHDDIEAMETRRATEVATALAAADRKANLRLGIIVAIIAAVNVALDLLR